MAALFPEVVRRLIIVSGAAVGDELDPEYIEDSERNMARHAGAPWYPEAMKAAEQWTTENVLAMHEPAELEALFKAMLPLYFSNSDTPVAQSHIKRLRDEMSIDLECWKAFEEMELSGKMDIRPLLRDVHCPTLVIAGEHDFACGVVQARHFADGIHGAKLVVIPRAGHLPQYERPEVFLAAVLDWCGVAGERAQS